MATRYSKRRPDGSVAYYDSEEEMWADQPATPPEPGLFEFSAFWAVIGFFASVFIIALTVYGLGLGEGWPKAVRFGAVVLSICVSTYLIGRAGQFLFQVFWALVGIGFVLGVLGAIVALLWHFA
nr:hypothetical protein [Stenotrophomonas geniculata]